MSKLALVAIALCVTTVTLAQGVGDDQSAFSGRLFPNEGMTRPTAEKGLLKDLSFFVVPFVLDTEGLRLAKLSGGVAYRGMKYPLRASIGYSYLDPDDADHLDQYSGSLLANVKQEDRWGLSVSLAYVDTKNASHKAVGTCSFETKLGPKNSPFSFGADLAWAKRGGGAGSVSDWIPAAKLIFERAPFGVGAEYVFENDVDGEDDYSLEFTRSVGKALLIGAGAGKNSTYFLYLLKQF